MALSLEDARRRSDVTMLSMHFFTAFRVHADVKVLVKTFSQISHKISLSIDFHLHTASLYYEWTPKQKNERHRHRHGG